MGYIKSEWFGRHDCAKRLAWDKLPLSLTFVLLLTACHGLSVECPNYQPGYNHTRVAPYTTDPVVNPSGLESYIFHKHFPGSAELNETYLASLFGNTPPKRLDIVPNGSPMDLGSNGQLLYTAGFTGDLMRYDLETEESVALPGDEPRYPVWNPSSSMYAFATYEEGKPGIAVYDASYMMLEALDSVNASHLDWLSDSVLVFVTNVVFPGIYAYTIGSGELVFIDVVEAHNGNFIQDVSGVPGNSSLVSYITTKEGLILNNLDSKTKEVVYHRCNSRSVVACSWLSETTVLLQLLIGTGEVPQTEESSIIVYYDLLTGVEIELPH